MSATVLKAVALVLLIALVAGAACNLYATFTIYEAVIDQQNGDAMYPPTTKTRKWEGKKGESIVTTNQGENESKDDFCDRHRESVDAEMLDNPMVTP